MLNGFISKLFYIENYQWLWNAGKLKKMHDVCEPQ